MKIVIPAREGSKGLPHKNRKLFKYTADIIPEEFKDDAYVLSDDVTILHDANVCNLKAAGRPKNLSEDTTSTKELMKYFVDEYNIPNDEIIIMLYLTYPEREWNDVIQAIHEFSIRKYKISSLLCRKEIKTSPYLMLKEESDGKGSQLIPHNLYRRQDYPKCFEISHYISIFTPDMLNFLNDNLYNNDTYFMPISDNTIDVDTQKDLDKLDETKDMPV